MEDDSDLTEVPTKCISDIQNVEVRCKVVYIDFEGRSDGDSIFKVVNAIKPRRVIIVRGNQENCKALGEYCQQVWTTT